MSKVITSSVIFIFSVFIFLACNSNNKQETEKIKQDSLKAANSDSAKLAKELNKFLIEPPDPDYSGDYVSKYPNGVIKFSGFFRFGQRHGEWLAFYDNGKVWSNCFYDKGEKHGATLVYHPNGQLFYKGWYKHDQKDSLWFFYDEQGKEVDRRAYRMGVETGLVY